jgi:hypothetical protein
MTNKINVSKPWRTSAVLNLMKANLIRSGAAFGNGIEIVLNCLN